ncbi:hypothetical protein CR513_27386, partial [Mucuna pruriens]
MKRSLTKRGKIGDMRNLIMKERGYGVLPRLGDEGWRRHADTWANSKRELRSQFVIASYTKDHYNRMQCMYQGSKSVEDYHRDMEVALTRANILEPNKATMAHFLHGLNRVIQDIVKLYHYASLYDLMH